ncbi:MAG: pro-sigmaK processing inhibitor BofA family protein [Acutalibacteraceae bacterium]|nr:pro-sigmaK processing inhibitor BofA family protein [Acutalibacteraceae bacterium]
MFKIIFILVSVIYGFLYLIFAAKTKKPFKTVFFYAFLGLFGLILTNLTASFSGVHIPVNAYSLGCSAALGLPGTIGLLILRIIFI